MSLFIGLQNPKPQFLGKDENGRSELSAESLPSYHLLDAPLGFSIPICF
ncbi:hypothetical protein COLO4_28299 [Corchorus olitorius]|uniref:Uncharacterized protein n=1 Tax=Corchorus olitorius TaxID=93759 RepID=A0A1R3HLY5_9ROSI|nr:hypothetical protein COLO4_28299 [Corchorus olitorius]